MKRIALIFALVILPLQYSWAAMSGYCKHEVGADAQHFGHHYHPQHKSLDGRGDVGNTAGAGHADCGLCHLAHSYAVHPAAPVSMVTSNAVIIVTQQDIHRSFLPDGPERPNWEFSASFRRDA